MKIIKAFFSPGVSGFFFDDQRAIKLGAEHNGFDYKGDPVTQGFKRIRVPGQSISIMLMLENGQIATGDCAAVQYSGAGGRDPLFLAKPYVNFLHEHIKPLVEGLEITRFSKLSKELTQTKIGGKPLHAAIKYGLSQAILAARAIACNKTPCEVICDEYDLPLIPERVPVFGQTGDNRYDNADKMIIKQVEVLPHALINNIKDKLGYNGEKLAEYINWLAQRVNSLSTQENYRPSFHIDVYGIIGKIFDNDLDKVAEYLAGLEKHSDKYELYIEGPVDLEEKNKQIDALLQIRQKLTHNSSRVKIVADEWCNTFEDVKDFVDAKCCHMAQIKTPDLGGIHNIVESVLYCKNNETEAYQGGTCNETDISARICVNLAMASRADRMLAKPGMGFDEGFCIVNNEMERLIATIKMRNGEV